MKQRMIKVKKIEGDDVKSGGGGGKGGGGGGERLLISGRSMLALALMIHLLLTSIWPTNQPLQI